jgi:uncharacterized protein YqjF (DUF2071 family)
MPERGIMGTFRNKSLEEILEQSLHPWVLFMTWRDLLFASWRVPVESLRPQVPNDLEIDTFDGSAWVSMVPMRVTDMHWRGIPCIPGMDSLRELNLRTYTTRNGKPGVYFLSIECPAAFSDWIAQHFFGVPYYEAQIATYNDGSSYNFAAERTQNDKPPAAFFASFRPEGEPFSPQPGTLESFLVERYCLYYVMKGVVYRGDIHHEEWKMKHAVADIAVNTVPGAAGLQLASTPDHVLFCNSTDTLIWPPVKE